MVLFRVSEQYGRTVYKDGFATKFCEPAEKIEQYSHDFSGVGCMENPPDNSLESSSGGFAFTLLSATYRVHDRGLHLCSPGRDLDSGCGPALFPGQAPALCHYPAGVAPAHAFLVFAADAAELLAAVFVPVKPEHPADAGVNVPGPAADLSSAARHALPAVQALVCPVLSAA